MPQSEQTLCKLCQAPTTAGKQFCSRSHATLFRHKTDGSIIEWDVERIKAKLVRNSQSSRTKPGCVEYDTRFRDNDGYGRVWVINKSYGAHRLAYMVHVGDIPEGIQVCHSCDNPPCINPEHLWLGTNTDNHKDKSVKGRSSIGARSNRSILTDDIVKAIKTDIRDGVRRKDILLKYPLLTIGAYNSIHANKTWKHVFID